MWRSFLKLGEMLRHDFLSSRIWNLDETGVITVQKLKKIITQKGSKQVNFITSGERGILVTIELAINANGNGNTNV